MMTFDPRASAGLGVRGACFGAARLGRCGGDAGQRCPFAWCTICIAVRTRHIAAGRSASARKTRHRGADGVAATAAKAQGARCTPSWPSRTPPRSPSRVAWRDIHRSTTSRRGPSKGYALSRRRATGTRRARSVPVHARTSTRTTRTPTPTSVTLTMRPSTLTRRAVGGQVSGRAPTLRPLPVEDPRATATMRDLRDRDPPRRGTTRAQPGEEPARTVRVSAEAAPRKGARVTVAGDAGARLERRERETGDQAQG
jgi:hypothetical protein